MAYRHNDTLHKHQSRARRFRKVTIFIVSLILIIALAIFIDWLLSQFNSSSTVTSRENTSSVQSANVSVYRTEYYQFQAPEEWVFVSSQSTEKKFVYVKNDGTLVSQRLIVYVDRPYTDREADYVATNVLPIEVNSLGNFVPNGKVSSHCKDSWLEGARTGTAERITHNGVSMVCHPSSAQYNVLIGVSGGNEYIPVTLKDGRKITLTLLFSDLTAYPTAGDIYNIVSSFNTL